MVLDVTITTDCPDTPNTARDRKVSKYAVMEVKDFVQNITGNRPQLFTACAINCAAISNQKLSPRPDCQQNVEDAQNTRLADLAGTKDPVSRNLPNPRSRNVMRRPECGARCNNHN